MRILEPYKNYFWEFYNSKKLNVRKKIDYVLQIVISAHIIPSRFFKHLNDGIYEIRIEFEGNIYRIFCFFDNDKLIILLHGFHKKSQRVPENELERAKKLRRSYYEDKKSQNNK